MKQHVLSGQSLWATAPSELLEDTQHLTRLICLFWPRSSMATAQPREGISEQAAQELPVHRPLRPEGLRLADGLITGGGD